MNINIPISGLNDIFTIKSTDFIPIVFSGSAGELTTYRVSVNEFNNWIEQSGSALSSSYALSSSVAFNAISTSYSLFATSASYALMASTASFISNALSSSHALSASFSNWATSASYALNALNSLTASYALNSLNSVSASLSSNSISSSFATSTANAFTSISASLAQTASYAQSASQAITSSFSLSGNSFVKAFGTFTYQRTQVSNVQIINNYNLYSASLQSAQSQANINPSSASYGNAHTWILYMANPLPTTNYTIITGMGGEPGTEFKEFTNYPWSARTTTAFSISLNMQGGGGFDDNVTEPTWFTIMVLHP